MLFVELHVLGFDVAGLGVHPMAGRHGWQHLGVQGVHALAYLFRQPAWLHPSHLSTCVDGGGE